MIAERVSMRLLAVTLLAWLAAPGAVVAGQNCAGGGAQRPDEGGIGGTGVHANRPDDEGGIGGTGIEAGIDTGVIGTITGFASICVGELEIHYGSDTPVEIDGQRAGVAALAVGQVVEVVAQGSGAELRAQRISTQHIVSGPVTGVDSGGLSIEVLRQRVQLTQATRIDLGTEGVPATAATVILATPVQVSGMRRSDGVIVASRVSAGADAQVRLSGRVSRVAGDELEIVGVPVRSAAPSALSLGDEVRVVGRWDGEAIIASSVEDVGRIPFGGRAAHLDIEGFARASATSGAVYLGPFLVELPTDVAASSASFLREPDVRVRVQAVVRGQHVVAERVAPAADLPAAPAPERPRGGSRGDGSGGGSREDEHGPGGQPGAHHEPNIRPERGADRGMGAGEMIAPHGVDMPPLHPEPPRLPDHGVPDRPMIERPEMPRPPERPERPPIPERPMRPDRPEHHDSHHGG